MGKPDQPWVEWAKNILIVLLTLSAVFLLSMTPLVQDSGLLDIFRPRSSGGGPAAGTAQTGTVLPVRLAVYRGEERYGVQYDDARMAELFAALNPLLGDALASAGPSWMLTEREWQRYLQRESMYFDFSGDVPLTVLSRWLGGEEGAAPEGSARRLALTAGGDDQVVLCWQDTGDRTFYACNTTLSRTLHLEPAVDGVTAGSAYFAFEDPSRPAQLEPYTLIAEGGTEGTRYTAANPLSAAAGIQAVLDALSFNSQNHAPGSSGEVYLDGGDRLVVGDSGTVTYRAAQEGDKYPVGPGAAGAADGARSLAEQVMGILCGDARLVPLSVQPWQEDGWRVRFGYCLNGASVYLYDEGWAAEFLVQGGYITGFTLHLRNYTAGEADVLLPPADRAAVMLPDVTDEMRELVIRYRDWGGTSVSPGWVGV